VGFFASAYEGGCRDPRFLFDYLGLLTGETRYAEVLEIIPNLDLSQRDLFRRAILQLSAHAKLALHLDRPALLDRALAREETPLWLPPDQVLEVARSHLREKQPFSLIRLGDGEARFTIAMNPELRPGVKPDETQAMADIVWENWFGEPFGRPEPSALEALMADYAEAVSTCDVLGVSDAMRLRNDTGHFGYLGTQELWIEPRLGANTRLTSALCHYTLERASPFLDTLISETDFLGLITPHPTLAELMRRRHAIAVESYVVPAEGRLPTAGETRALGQHFPDIYRKTLDEISVPHRGALFLVAAGLLGKVYCSRIRALGGIAIDMGSIVDGWMGFNTRPGQLDTVGRLEG
jgi:hypothetical protein